MKSSANKRPSLLRVDSREREKEEKYCLVEWPFSELAHALRSDQKNRLCTTVPT